MALHADQASCILPEPWHGAITQAAWLHDVGYGVGLVDTGMHALDGARWLERHDWPTEVCRLVAWHSSAEQEAALRGLKEQLEAEFERPNRLAAAALAWADLTSSPTGEPWPSERRLADILQRHAPGSVVHRATVAALPALRTEVSQIESRLRGGPA